ncbi:MAG: hypothetical protein J6P98_07220, partial [Clostridia bacterium]|nr:hypothetical protein [Clostridia bacterium]
MKKLLCLLAACALLLALAVPAFAAAGSARLYITGPSTAKIGDTVKVSLNISGNYSAHTMNIRVIYDTTSYRYLGNTPGDVYNYAVSHQGMCLIDLSQSTNMVSLGVIMWGSEALSEEGELAEFSFEVLPTAAKQTNFVVLVEDMDYLPIGESIATPVNYTTEDLTVTISNGSTSSTTTLAPHLTPGTTYVADNTPAPADGMPTSPSVTKAPNPDNTSDPHGALPTTAPDKTEPPSADGTPAPGETEQPETS